MKMYLRCVYGLWKIIPLLSCGVAKGDLIHFYSQKLLASEADILETK